MFFKKIFKKGKPKEPEIVSLSLDSLRERVDALKKERLAEVQPKLAAVLDKIIGKKEWLLLELKNLEAAEPSEEIHPGLYKTVDGARRLLIGKLNRSLAYIKPPGGTTPTDLSAIDDSLTRAVNLATDAVVTHGRYVARLFSSHLRTIESRLREVHELARDVHILVEGALADIHSLEDILSKIELRTGLLQQVEDLRARIESLEKRTTELEGLVEDGNARLAQFTSSEEFKQFESSQRELEQTEQEFERAQTVATTTILNFSRPLRKMRKLAMTGEYQMNKETAEVLEVCIENPLRLFSSDEKLDTAVAVLQGMLELIEAEKISLDAREHRRKIEDARALLASETLAKLRENIERLRAKKEALNQLCQNSPVLRRKMELERAVDESMSELKTVKTTLEELRHDLQKIEEGIGKNKLELEEAASGVIGAAVNITS